MAKKISRFLYGIKSKFNFTGTSGMIYFLRRYRFFAAGLLAVIIALALSAKLLKKNECELAAPAFVYKGVIQKGDTIYGLLKGYQINDNELLSINKEFKKNNKSTAEIRPGDNYEVSCSTTGILKQFKIKHINDPFRFFEISRSSDGFYNSSIKNLEIKKFTQGVQGKITTSLYEAMVKQGLSPEMVMKFADIFQWEIDFLTEPRAGDSYKMVWERIATDDGYSKDGRILAAGYLGRETADKTAVLFKSGGGVESYYDIKGGSKRKTFLRAPLNFRRISSYFSYKRFHPILRYYRPHLGIDYAASHGTPVVTIGDGVVEYAGWKGQAGKCVIIKHNSIYKTNYGHLSRFAKGIHKGAQVKQGQLIGYVGSTGLSTGPHLDFRIFQYGKPVNFLKLKIPPAEGVKGADLERFNIEKKKLLYYMSELDMSPSEQDIVTLEDKI